MKVLLVNGSPHVNGCTHTALGIVADELRANGVEADEFWIQNKPIAGCIACMRCMETKKCVFNDRVEEFIAAAGAYDGFVFGAPVYFSGMAGNMKCFMDRAFYANQGRVDFARKPAAVVTSARRAGTTATLEDLEKFIQYSEMLQVNTRYWPMVHGSTPEQVLQDEEGVQLMQVLGRNMAWLLKCLEAARAAGVPDPEPYGSKVFTNFIR